MQYLYLIQCQQFFKIGIANDVEGRLAQLSTGNPFELKVLAVYGFSNAESVERSLHQRFANTRARGEWFSLDDRDLLDVEQICQLLGGAKKSDKELPTVGNEEISEAEVLAVPTEEGTWDFQQMFKDGWRMEAANDGERHKYWCWRRGYKENRQYIYGGRIENLPLGSIEEMRRVFRDGRLYQTYVKETVGNE